LLCKVELCLKCIEDWGFEYDSVARSVESTYPEVLQMIYRERLEKNFGPRCKKLEAVASNYDLIPETLIN